MLKSLELSALKADIAAVDSLLASRTEDDDPIGWYQFTARKDQLLQQLGQLANSTANFAAVALYFGGKPVIGSRGVDANFAGHALEYFQDIVAKRYAAASKGEALKERGPIPNKHDAALLVTEVARGSFGFVLEESGQNEQEPLLDTPLKKSVEEVATLIRDLAKDDLENSAEFLDDRMLASLRNFFSLLDDSGATMRLVEGVHDVQFDRDEIYNARLKTDSIAVQENERTERGVLYITPDSQRFDLEIDPPLVVVRGRVERSLLNRLRRDNDAELKRVLGTKVTTSLLVKDVTTAGGNLRSTYTLTDIN